MKFILHFNDGIPIAESWLSRFNKQIYDQNKVETAFLIRIFLDDRIAENKSKIF